ncbi:MAG: choice-of-anchor D domain-containing protein [Archangium sp.]|nr:choice-of-anchor D domain-containing protein [Archangium sp.]
MRLPALTTVLCFLAACSPAPLVHDDSMVFGDVELGQSRRVALVLTNSGSAPQALAFEATGDFTVEEARATLGGGATSSLMVRFSPTDLGARAGTLVIGDVEVALSGRGTGPRFSAAAQVTLPPITLVTGETPRASTSKLVVQNAGTAGSALKLGAPRVDGAELCVGTFVGSTCEPWVPPASVETQTLLEVPLSVLVTTPGARRWSVVFPSNDALRPEVTIQFAALVEAYEPCVFSAPAEVVLINRGGVLDVTHQGPGTCLVEAITLESTPAGHLEFVSGGPMPLRLAPGAVLSRAIRVRPPSTPAGLVGKVRVLAAGTAALEVPIRVEPPSVQCLVIAPRTLDFGTVRRDCASPNRNVQLYNACSRPITVQSVVVGAAAGEGPGGPNCPGTAPCPEFFLVSGPPAATVIQPGNSTPVLLTLRYRPINYGPDTGAVLISTLEEGDLVVALQARGDLNPLSVDTFRQDPLPIIDVLLMVDASPSFVPKRASVRANLTPMLTSMSSRCIDARLGFAAADGAPGASAQLLANDAGMRWTSSGDPQFVERALSAFDALPVGSEIEACIGPAADLVQDAGLRTGSSLSGLCITDALEQSPSPMSSLQALQAQRPASRFSWSAVTALSSSTCAVETADDGTHQGLVTASNGAREDICNPSWWQSFVGLGTPTCGFRTTFYLSSLPASPSELELTIDGRPVPASDWMLDLTLNAVVFAPDKAPAPGETLEIKYRAACVP